jgi:lipoprotein NlpD
LDYRRFAAANQIGPPFTIYPGQKLRLSDVTSPAATTTRGRAAAANAPSKSAVAQKPSVTKTQTAKSAVTRRPEPARVAAKAPQKTTAQESKAWFQPLPQKPSVVFGKNSKGLDYAVSSRARVRNAQRGEVVYAGNGIAGFERLVIVKHSSELLSAYSFNGKMLVAEQQQVSGGEVIAEILPRPGVGQTLHFELRRKGLPINPQTLIR